MPARRSTPGAKKLRQGAGTIDMVVVEGVSGRASLRGESAPLRGAELDCQHFPIKVRPPWRATVLTLFPEMFPGPLGVSLVGEALQPGLWSLRRYPIREFGIGRHRAVDDTPAGGGAGMVMRADVLAAAIDHAAGRGQPRPPLIYLRRAASC